jgi:hypothetical protein
MTFLAFWGISGIYYDTSSWIRKEDSQENVTRTLIFDSTLLHWTHLKIACIVRTHMRNEYSLQTLA